MNSRLIILHNIRSAHNVGAIVRSAACFGDFSVICSGYTPYPTVADDSRLPHLQRKQTAAIAKTALGAESMLPIMYEPDVMVLIASLTTAGYHIVACEQTTQAIPLTDWRPAPKTAVIFGNEPKGIDDQVLLSVKHHLVIPQRGRKESLNVASAAAIVLYEWSLR